MVVEYVLMNQFIQAHVIMDAKDGKACGTKPSYISTVTTLHITLVNVIVHTIQYTFKKECLYAKRQAYILDVFSDSINNITDLLRILRSIN